MKKLMPSAVLALVVYSVVCCAQAAWAQEVTLIAPGGMRCPIDRMKPDFEKKTGLTLKATIGAGGATHQQVVQGAPFDVPVVQPPYKDVIDSGSVVSNTETPLATVAIVVVVKKGDPKPDISTADAVKRMLLSAKAISYPDGAGGLGGAAGVSVGGQLPRDISTPTALVGFISSHAKSPEAAKALLAYLSGPDGATAYKACAMTPGR